MVVVPPWTARVSITSTGWAPGRSPVKAIAPSVVALSGPGPVTSKPLLKLIRPVNVMFAGPVVTIVG